MFVEGGCDKKMKGLETEKQKHRFTTRILKDRKTKKTDYGLKQGKTERQKEQN